MDASNESAQPQGPGLTVYLQEGTTRQLEELTDKIGSPSMPAALKVIVERAYRQMIGKGTAIEQVPLCSFGQGDYRRDIMAEDC